MVKKVPFKQYSVFLRSLLLFCRSCRSRKELHLNKHSTHGAAFFFEGVLDKRPLELSDIINASP